MQSESTCELHRKATGVVVSSLHSHTGNPGSDPGPGTQVVRIHA